jgi:pyridoxamine 5'-phosphate oxidase
MMTTPSISGGRSDDALSMLRACHERIRKELATLDRLRLHVPENGCDEDARTMARDLLGYFDAAVPRHDADEEQSLVPRLLATSADGAAGLVDKLHAQHGEIAGLWRELRPDLAAIESGERSVLTPDLVRRTRATFLAHLDFEESQLFPFAAAHLDDATFQVIAAEMAARRGGRITTKQGAGGAPSA